MTTRTDELGALEPTREGLHRCVNIMQGTVGEIADMLVRFTSDHSEEGRLLSTSELLMLENKLRELRCDVGAYSALQVRYHMNGLERQARSGAA